MKRGPSPAARLERALTASADAAGARLEIAAYNTVAWRSATFAGERHEMEACAMSGQRLDRWLAALPDSDLPIPGHLLADVSVARCERVGEITRFRLEGVTVATG